MTINLVAQRSAGLQPAAGIANSRVTLTEKKSVRKHVIRAEIDSESLEVNLRAKPRLGFRPEISARVINGKARHQGGFHRKAAQSKV
ncbi:MAG: hypothetical protein JWM99_122, partial [Verrucomicrobiales bacterium]|nr:hypothetical protein [Verrucomicrobiales bacterium]